MSRKELSGLDGAGLVSAPGEAQPELLVCWESLSLHPTPWAGCRWVPDTSSVLGGSEREEKRLHIPVASGLFAQPDSGMSGQDSPVLCSA